MAFTYNEDNANAEMPRLKRGGWRIGKSNAIERSLRKALAAFGRSGRGKTD